MPLKLRSLDYRSVVSAVRIKLALLPPRSAWPSWLKYEHGKLRFNGCMTKAQLALLRTLSSNKKYLAAIAALYKKSNQLRQWNVHYWAARGYVNEWRIASKHREYFALLRAQGADDLVVLCPTFVRLPLRVTVCRRGEYHLLTGNAGCRMCGCGLDDQVVRPLHKRLRLCPTCWVKILTLTDEVDSSINAAFKTAAATKFGEW